MPAETTENQPFHAHWDCGQGATCSSLLDACLEAWSSLKNLMEEDALKGLCDMLQQALPGEKDVQVLSIQRHQQGILKISWEYQGESAELDSIATIITHCQLSENIRQQVVEIPWSNHVFQEGIAKEEDWNAFLSMLGVLLLLDDIKTYSISCDPLPVQNVSTDSLQSMIGMPTDPNGKGYLEPAAISLLKVLLQRTTPTNTTTSPPMTLQAVGIGRILDSIDDNNNPRQSRSQGKRQQEVRLMIGIPIQETIHNTDNGNGQQVGESWKVDRLVHMEANLDDITAEALAFAVEMLLKHGAIDAWTTPIVMKKGRPAHTLHCLCYDDKKTGGNPEKISWKSLSKLVFQHTTTLGIRTHRGLERVALRRSFLTVQTPYLNTAREGRVNVKVGYLGNNDDDNEVVSVKAEFDHCKEIALETGVPLQQISASALQEAYVQLEREKANKRS